MADPHQRHAARFVEIGGPRLRQRLLLRRTEIVNLPTAKKQQSHVKPAGLHVTHVLKGAPLTIALPLTSRTCRRLVEVVS